MTPDHAARLRARIDEPHTLWNLPEAARVEIRAVLDELKQLRDADAVLVPRLRDAYRTGWDDRHYSALAALGLASSNRDFLAGQHIAKVLGEMTAAVPQQSEHDGGDAT